MNKPATERQILYDYTYMSILPLPAGCICICICICPLCCPCPQPGSRPDVLSPPDITLTRWHDLLVLSHMSRACVHFLPALRHPRTPAPTPESSLVSWQHSFHKELSEPLSPQPPLLEFLRALGEDSLS